MDHLPQRGYESMVKQTQVHRKGRTKLANLREAVNPENSGIVQQTAKWRITKNRLDPNWRGYISEPTLCRGDDGLSNRVARIKAIGK